MSTSDSLPPDLSDDGASGLDAAVPAIMYRLTRRRRLVLELLLDARTPIDVAELATQVAAREADTQPSSIDEGAREAVVVELRQVDLPALEDVSLVEWTPSAGTVRTSDHPVFDEHWFERLVRADAELDALVEALASERRLAVLETLDETPVPQNELAERIAAGEPASSADDVRISLRHGHLPKLEDAGLVECVPADGKQAVDGPLVRRTCSTVEQAWLQYLADE